MRNMLKGINARHHEALSRLFVVQVAIIAACYLVNADGPMERSGWLIFLSFFVWPLIAAWPARRGWMLRGVVTNGLAILFTIAYIAYFKVGVVADWLLLSTILAFGMVSGMAAGGLVERRRSRLRAVSKGRSPSTHLPLPSVTALSYFEPAASDFRELACPAISPANPARRQ